MRRILVALGTWGALFTALLFLVLPVAAILFSTSPIDLANALTRGGSAQALWLSLRCSLAALAVILLVGTPAAWVLATRSFRGNSLITTLIELPLVLPPAVAGLGLLAAFGPHGWLGGTLSTAHVDLVLETAGVVVALVFVAAPFHVRQAAAAFRELDPKLIEAARTLGADDWRTFIRVAVPTCSESLTAGAALAWARALGEFGATLMFAGSLASVTQTAPLAIYDSFPTDFVAAQSLSAVLVAAAGAVLLATRILATRGQADRAQG